jgi:hypothetical protein
MTGLLQTDHGPGLSVPPARPQARRVRWMVGLAAGALLAVTLGLLVADQVTADDRSHRAQASLGVTRQEARSVSAQLAELRRGLSVLETQVGNDTTALSQDASQLLGAQTSLAAAQAHVTQQSSLITSLQTCLVGVEQALNQLAVGRQKGAIASLNSVASSCAAAEASNG